MEVTDLIPILLLISEAACFGSALVTYHRHSYGISFALCLTGLFTAGFIVYAVLRNIQFDREERALEK